MEIINLTHKKLMEMPVIGYGSNAKIRLLNFNEVAKIYGIYDDHEFISTESDEEKIELIYQKNPIEFTTFPKKKIYVDNTFAGFSMDNIRASKQLIYSKENLTVQKRMDILIKIKNILLKMFKQNIYMIDLNEFNILIKNNLQPYIIDIDSVLFDSELQYVILERFYQLAVYYLYDNLDFGELTDLSNVEPIIKHYKRRDKLNNHLQQLNNDIEEIEKVREVILKHDKPYLKASF